MLRHCLSAASNPHHVSCVAHDDNGIYFSTPPHIAAPRPSVNRRTQRRAPRATEFEPKWGSLRHGRTDSKHGDAPVFHGPLEKQRALQAVDRAAIGALGSWEPPAARHRRDLETIHPSRCAIGTGAGKTGHKVKWADLPVCSGNGGMQ